MRRRYSTLPQRINVAISWCPLTFGRDRFLLGRMDLLMGRSLHGRSLVGFLSAKKFFYTTTVCRNENLLLNTLTPSHNAIRDTIVNSKLSLLEKQLKIEKIVREY